MHAYKIIKVIMSGLLMASAAISCSIKADRSECPCYLDITFVRQAERTFADNKAWYGVWNGENKIREGIFSPVIGKDSTLSHPVPRGRTASVIVSNTEQTDSRISVESGSQMVELYISRKDVNCVGEDTRVEFDSFCKQYVNVTFLLAKEAYSFRDSLRLAVEGLYDGISLPSLSPHTGAFRYITDFDEHGKTQVRIPPQGGPGLKVGIQLKNDPPAVIDLYRTMLEAGFDWKENNLTDFELRLGLNTVSGIIQIIDWNIVLIEDIKF